jgi:hypothetical protein
MLRVPCNHIPKRTNAPDNFVKKRDFGPSHEFAAELDFGSPVLVSKFNEKMIINLSFEEFVLGDSLDLILTQ